MYANCFRCRRDAPDHIADVVGDQQRTVASDRDADRASLRLAVRSNESGEDVFRWTGWFVTGERHEDHLVAALRPAVPRPVLTDEGTAAITRREKIAGINASPNAATCEPSA